MGTTALVLILEGSVGGFIMNFFLLSSVISLSLAAPAPDAEAKAAIVHPILAHHVAPLAVVPAKQLQWPGITAPGVDTTCFGCRHAVVVGRKRREAEAVAEADAEAEAEATADAEPVAEAAAAPFYPLAVTPHYPYHVPAVALRSSGYATVNNAGVSYSTGVHAVHVLPLGRRRRDADADAEADADAYYHPYFAAAAVNGYAHNLGSGNSYAAISSGLPYQGVYGYPYAYLG